LIFRQATLADLPQMMSLWHLCFPEDDEAFVCRFFAETPIEQGLVACKGEVLSMLFLLPAELVVDGNRYPVRYLYAGCTHPDFRHGGVFAALLRYALRFVQEAGECGIYLCPADYELASYYEKQGYRGGIGGWLGNGMYDAALMHTVSVEEYRAARDRFLPTDLPYFRLGEQAERFFCDELRRDGWQLLSSDSGCCVLSEDGSFAYDCLGALPAVSCYGAVPTATKQNTAWWISTEQGKAIDTALLNGEAYTAFLGDF